MPPAFPTKMMKIEMKVEISDSNTRKEVFSAVSGLLGIVSMAMDTKENKIMVIGTTDPVKIVEKVRKIQPSAAIVSVWSEKVEPKKEEPQPKVDRAD